MFAKKQTGKAYLRWWTPVLSIASIVVLLLQACGPSDAHNTEPQQLLKIRVGVAMQPTNALMIIAREKGFMTQHGLAVEYSQFPSGKRTLYEGLFAQKVDFASSSDLPVALAAVERSDFRIIASIFSADNVNRVVARRSAGIEQPTDLHGKKIATQKRSAVHYFWHVFSLMHGLAPTDYNLSFMKAEQLPRALANGKIDAFSMREPYLSEAKSLLAGDVVVFGASGMYEQMELLVAETDFVTQKPEETARVLRALLDAERFAKEAPKEAIAVVATHLGASPAYMTSIWSTVRLRVALPQSLISLLENEAQWAIDQHLTRADKLPNYLRLIEQKPLSKLDSKRVTIF